MESLSRFMKWCAERTPWVITHIITGGYATYITAIQEPPDPNDEHFSVVCRYVERNAVRAKVWIELRSGMGFPMALDLEAGITNRSTFGMAVGETSELGEASQRSIGNDS